MLSAKTILYTFTLGALVLAASSAALGAGARLPRRHPVAAATHSRVSVTSPSPEHRSRGGGMRCALPGSLRAEAPHPTWSSQASAGRSA